MIVELRGERRLAAMPLFGDSDTRRIARAVCLGLAEGRVLADDADAPAAAVAFLPKMRTGCAAGSAASAGPLLKALRDEIDSLEIADPPEDWFPALAAASKRGDAYARFALSPPASGWDMDALQKLSAPPEGCAVTLFDRALADQALASKWSEDQIGAFPSVEAYLKDGLGMALTRDGQLLAGCSSFCRLPGGYEIQIDTHPDMRRRGYAACVGAAFILEATRRGLTPCWDAASAASLRLAQRLGFVFTRAFLAWELGADAAGTDT